MQAINALAPSGKRNPLIYDEAYTTAGHTRSHVTQNIIARRNRLGRGVLSGGGGSVVRDNGFLFIGRARIRSQCCLRF
jgi:hypothetical protein